MLAELLRERVLRSSAKSMEKWVSVGRIHVYDGDIRVMFLEPGFVRGGSCATLKSYSLAANKTRILRTGDCEVHAQRVYSTKEFDAGKKMLNIVVVV